MVIFYLTLSHTSAVSGFRSIFNALSMLFSAGDSAK